MSAINMLAGASLLAAAFALAAPAQAQRVDRIVAFGDSYADDGNLFELIGIPRPAVYPNGRFSDGTNFVDTMAQILGVPVDNFAIGGAFAGNGNINGPGIPGFATEYQSFLAGGGPAAFPRVSGTFDADDLVVVSIGGNDARAYEQSLGLTPTAEQISALIAGVPAQAQQRVAEATFGIDALVDAGARNITFLAGDVGRLPEVAGLPVAAVGSAYAGAFNQGMQQSLAAFADQGVIVNWLDLNLIGDQVEDNLAAFGLTSTGACPVACVTTNPELLGRYLFYVDQVHLTSAGFAIVGRYAVRQLEAPLHLEAQADVGLQAGNSFATFLLGRVDLSYSRFQDGGGGGLRFFAGAHSESRGRDATQASLGYDLDTFGLSAGVEYDSGNGALFGAALNRVRSEADLDSATGRAKAEGWQAGAYGAWSGGGAFVSAYAGYGWLDYRIDREAVIDWIEARPDGNVLIAGGRAGYLFDVGAIRLGPVLSARYAEAEIDAFTETGDPVLTLNVRDQTQKSLVGSLGLELRAELDAGGMAVRPFAIAAVEREFEGDSRTIRYAGTASPGIVNRWVLPGRSEDVYGRLTAGADFQLGGRFSLQLHGSASIGQEESEDIGGSLVLKIGL